MKRLANVDLAPQALPGNRFLTQPANVGSARDEADGSATGAAAKAPIRADRAADRPTAAAQAVVQALEPSLPQGKAHAVTHDSEGRAATAPPSSRPVILSRFEKAEKRTLRDVRSVLSGLVRQLEVSDVT